MADVSSAISPRSKDRRSDSGSPTLPDSESPESRSGSSSRKNGVLKDIGHSLRFSVNRSASQFKKTPHRRIASPLNWFPRKKGDSFLKRKIRHLQEAEGMNSSLDETLGNANPHYTRMTKEKIAAKEAARKAMESHKAAMVEASWCRILRAARINSKEAEDMLVKAQKRAVEDFEAARGMGVMIYDRPDHQRQPAELSSTIGGRSANTVTASFETAFEVDKEVLAAVKKAFIQLANCPSSSNKEDFRELLHKISENPDSVTDKEITHMSSESEIDSVSELEPDLHVADYGDDNAVCNNENQVNHKKYKCAQNSIGCNSNSSKSFIDLASTMLDRLKGLQEDELSSLVIIVATCGLNAALREVESSKDVTDMHSSFTHFVDGRTRGKETATDLPSLDKFLVKRVSRLEREVQEARKSVKSSAGCLKRSTSSKQQAGNSTLIHPNRSAEVTADLGSILVKHVSKLEREIQEAKNSRNNSSVGIIAYMETGRGSSDSNIQEFGEKEHRQCDESQGQESDLHESVASYPLDGTNDKESVGNNTLITLPTKKPPVKAISRIERAKLEALRAFLPLDGRNDTDKPPGLDQILVKPVNKMDRGQMHEVDYTYTTRRSTRKEETDIANFKSLDKVLVKHVSRLEKERTAPGTRERYAKVEKKQQQNGSMESLDDIFAKSHQTKPDRNKGLELELHETKQSPVKRMSRIEIAKQETLKSFSSSNLSNEKTELAGLAEILVKSVHGLEREKMHALPEGSDCTAQISITNQETGVSAPESLDKILVKHVSRLEREKMTLGTRENFAKLKKRNQECEDMGSLDAIFVKHQPENERAKVAAWHIEDQAKQVNPRREAREKDLQQAWGGLSLGNSMRPHLSRLEREKAEWRRAEEEQKRQAATTL